MPELKFENGKFIDAEGNEVNPELNGEAVTLVDVVSQSQLDKTIDETIGRERAKLRKLEEAAKAAPGLEDMVREKEAHIQKLESEKSEAVSKAQEEHRAQLEKTTQRADTAEARVAELEKSIVTNEVTGQIISAAGNRFNDVQLDVVPNLLGRHKREEILQDGKGTGRFEDLFEMEIENEKGEKARDWVDVNKAVETWANTHKHHVAANPRGGSGGGGSSLVESNSGDGQGFSYPSLTQ